MPEILLSFFSLTIALQACSITQTQSKVVDHFSHNILSDSNKRTFISYEGKTIDEYIRYRFLDADIQEKRVIFHNGWNYYKQKEWDKAEDWFEKALEEYPYLKDYSTFYISICLENKGKYREAVSLINKIIEKWPESALIQRAYLKQADIYFGVKEYDKAIEAYEKSLGAFPEEDAYIRFQIGLANLEIGKWESALENFKALLINEPDSEFSKSAQQQMETLRKEKGIGPLLFSREEMLQKGEILFNKKQYEEAIKAYLEVVDSKSDPPERCDALYNLARCYKRIGKRDLAIDRLKEVIKFSNKSECASRSRLLLARYLWNEHRNKEAYKQLEFLRKNNPKWGKNDEVVYIMGRMAEGEGRLIDSIKYYNEVLNSKQKSSISETVIWRIGWVYYIGGFYKEAISHFEKYLPGIKNSTFQHRLLYWKARAEEKKGDKQSAIKTYKSILKEPYWSFYSGLTEIWLGYQDDPNREDNNNSNNIFKDEAIFPDLNEKEKVIVTRLLELWLNGLKEECTNEITHKVYSKERYSPELLFYLSSIAHMNGAHELGIRIGIRCFNRTDQSDEVSFHKAEDLLLYPLGFLSIVEEKAKQYSIDPILVLSVIRQESLFDPDALSRSSAYGLMQIIPSTGNVIAKELGIDLSSDLNILFDPDTNLTFGCFFLKRLLDKFEQNIVYALASYNAGPEAVLSWQNRFGYLEIDEFIENIPYSETRDYVKRILKNYWIYRRIYTPLTIPDEQQA
ncbi:MAG: tetratricopeptide repeat protein [bacterium]